MYFDRLHKDKFLPITNYARSMKILTSSITSNILMQGTKRGSHENTKQKMVNAVVYTSISICHSVYSCTPISRNEFTVQNSG